MYFFIQKNICKNKHTNPSNTCLTLADRIPATGNSSSNYECTVNEWLLKEKEKEKSNEEQENWYNWKIPSLVI